MNQGLAKTDRAGLVKSPTTGAVLNGSADALAQYKAAKRRAREAAARLTALEDKVDEIGLVLSKLLSIVEALQPSGRLNK